MIANLFVIKGSKIQGKGIFAKKFVPKGTIIYFDCRKCRPWTKKHLEGLSKKELQFVFEHDYPIKYCDDRLLYNNHSCNANTMDLGNDVSIVVSDIKKGEEQTEDYRIYCDSDVHFKDGCKCGVPNCMRRKVYLPPPPKTLQKFWNSRINSALRLATLVEQPLKRELLRVHPELTPLFGKNPKKRDQIITKLTQLRTKGHKRLTASQRKALEGISFSYAG